MANGATGGTGPTGPSGSGSSSGKAGTSSDLSITSIALLVAPLVAALALLTATGTIGRIQRDHPGLFTLAIALVLLAGLIWVLVSLPKRKEGRGWWIPRIAAGVLAAAGFILAMGLAIELVGDEPRPRIAAALNKDRTVFEATVTASGLSTPHRLAIEVDALRRSPEDPDEFLGSDRLYRAYIGPDTDGNVSQTVKVPVPRRDFTDIGIKAYTGETSYGCDDYPTQAVRRDKNFGSGTACVTLALIPLTKGGKRGRG